MGKEIKSISLSRLSSQNNVFDEIVFHKGINLILGEKFDESFVQGRKTNGVGKSMCIEFINFCFLCEYDKSRIAKIPNEIFPMDENVNLEFLVGSEKIVISRNRKDQERPIFYREDNKVQFNKLSDAKQYLQDLIFVESSRNDIPSIRSFMSILMRDERSEFTDIIKCHDLSKRIPEDLTVHLFMLGISLANYRKFISIIKDIEKTQTVLAKTKIELTDNGTKKIEDVKAEMNALNSELERLENALDAFKSNEAFSTVEKELIQIESELDSLRNRQKIFKLEYEKIKKIPQLEFIDDSEIELVYNQFRDKFGSAVVKTLKDVVNFKNKIEEFQNGLVNHKVKELENQITEISEKIRILDEQYADKVRIVDKKGILKNLKVSLGVYQSKKESLSHVNFLLEQYDKYDKTKRQLNISKQQELLNIDSSIEELSEELKSFNMTISNIHEAVMGNRECSFEIKPKQANSRSKTPVDITLRIFDDGSRSVDRTKVFIYDMALMFNEHTNKRHPSFLIHDNIFDVDQDTLVQCLNYLYKQEQHYFDFQYILTLNRDKIENEERKKILLMNVDEHKVATFTKAAKFLKENYQER